MDDLDRLFHRLVHSIRATQPEYLARPFEIAELYQKLVPYRLHRRELQIETNQDYEAAVTRLLAGERGYLVGDEGMQEFLRTELTSPNPDVAVFREFGSNHVAIAPGALEKVGVDGVPPVVEAAARLNAPPAYPAREMTTRAPEPLPAAGVRPPPHAPLSPRALEAALERSPPEIGVAEEISPPVASTPSTAPAQSSAPDMPAPRSVTASDVGGKCRYCSGVLPEGRKIVFCPHCGQNLTVHRCPACSTELEMGWKFCVTCGRSAAAAP
jgi:hypothetical protein